MIENSNANIIEFSMPELMQFMVLKAPVYGAWTGFLVCFAGFLLTILLKKDANEIIKSSLTSLIIWAIVIIFFYFYSLINKRRRHPFKLVIDKERKEIKAIICLSNDLVILKPDDINFVENNTEWLIFNMKNGTKINWIINPKTELSLESIVSSIGIPIRFKPLSWS